ncbi:MAG: hypothetical protein Q8K24_11270 [Hydrogenophaga sp.]|nr:hypothetical protein [Hydrogenophaga sp.]
MTQAMPTLHRLEFGYFPEPLNISSGPITVCQLADLALTIANVEGGDQLEQGWIYAPPQLVRNLGGHVRQRPYSARVFGLPKTHAIAHASSEGQVGISDQRDRWFRYRDRGFRPIVTDSVVGSS